MELKKIQIEFMRGLLSNNETRLTITPAHRFTIYQNNLFSALFKALKNTYPYIVKIVGEASFSFLAKSYIKVYPCTQPKLHHYGEYFSTFLKTHFLKIHDCSKKLIYLPEVAAFEWAIQLAYLGADHLAFETKKLAAFPQNKYDQIVFKLHPTCQLIQLTYPILQIAKLCEGELANPIDLDEGGNILLIYRPALDILFVELTQSEFHFLKAQCKHQSLDQALKIAFAYDSHFPFPIKLPEWIHKKIIVDFMY